MAEQNPPIWMDGTTAPGADLRRMTTAIMGPGIARLGDLAVTEHAGTPNMSVDVAAGAAFVAGTSTTYQGSYFVENRATVVKTIAAAHATNARKDIVVARVRENAIDASGVSAWDIAVVTGTPSGSPAAPATPANSLLLATIDVPANDTAITNNQITSNRSLARPWNSAWGVVSSNTISSSQTGIAAGPTDLTGFTGTLTPVAGRRLKIVANATAFSGVGGWQIHVLRNGTDIGRACVVEIFSTATRLNIVSGVYDTGYTPGTATTYKLTATRYSGANTFDVQTSTVNGYFAIEDVGPA